MKSGQFGELTGLCVADLLFGVADTCILGPSAIRPACALGGQVVFLLTSRAPAS